jgi:cytidine deaminase
MISALSADERAALEDAARLAGRNSYSPYSGFPVGAAVLDENGRIHVGCNVENASFGLTCCAERTALFNAVSHGARTIRAVAVHTPTARVTLPCGACRQVLLEFGPRATVICICDSDHRIETTLDALLPDAFDRRPQQGPEHGP